MSNSSGDLQGDLSNGPVGRLAPSPTGVLHLGNARTFLLAWLSIRARGGTLRLRIEDIDGPRVKPDADRLLLEDLNWLGLDWDGPVWRQSERLGHYDSAIRQLLTAGLAYPCVCTRKEIEEAASAPHEPTLDGAIYPGTCRGRYSSLAAARAATGRDPAVRMRVEVENVPFLDGFQGPQHGTIRGDFVIAKRDGGPAYQLAVVVDDAAEGIDEVLRGDDLLPSTPRQLLLYQALSLSAPDFCHIPLVVGPDGLRLAKRHGDTSLRRFRAAGVSPGLMVGYLAALSGLVPPGTECRPVDLLTTFDLARVPRFKVVADERLEQGPVAPQES